MASRMIRTQLCALTALLAVITVAPVAEAQIIPFTPAGVEIDADGVLRARVFNDATGELTRQRFQAAQQSLSGDLQRPSDLRKVSLNRLEAHIGQRLAEGQRLDDAIRNLAGLTRITHVFFYPESGDIVIAGPAEGFFMDASGRMVGMQTGQAVLQLEDLLVALRAFAPDSPSTTTIGCSIDPTREGLARYQGTVAEIAARTRSNQLAIQGNELNIMNALREALGNQVVTIQGVPADSHFARVLVEADYRMKMIGIGLEKPQVDIPSWAEKVKFRAVAKNALQRWYFTPDYQRITVNPDETAMQLTGNGVKLIGADERVSANGARSTSGSGDRASRNFTREFTEHYTELAEKSPVYAQLRNLMDMSIVAAFIKEMDYYNQANWKAELFGDESRLPVQAYQAPTSVEPLVNGMWRDGQFAAPIGGGVNIQPTRALTVDNIQVDDIGKIDEVKTSVRLDHLADGQWWWD